MYKQKPIFDQSSILLLGEKKDLRQTRKELESFYRGKGYNKYYAEQKAKAVIGGSRSAGLIDYDGSDVCRIK